jgi:hypothetical protein
VTAYPSNPQEAAEALKGKVEIASERNMSEPVPGQRRGRSHRKF